MHSSLENGLLRWPVIAVLLLLLSVPETGRAQSTLRLSAADAVRSSGEAVIESANVRHVIRVPVDEPGPVIPVSYRDVRADREWLAQGAAPWFEIAINGTIVTSNDAVWLLEETRARPIRNGGEELTLGFRSADGPSEGVLVTVRIQAFPASTLLRQQLEVSGAGHRLSHHQGAPHLRFPRYRLNAGADAPLDVREIRIATWNAELLPEATAPTAPDERDHVEGWREGRDLSQNYMYHPVRSDRNLDRDAILEAKGPIALTRSSGAGGGWVTLYEHGSPDDDFEQDYLSIDHARNDSGVDVGVQVRSGAYFEGEQPTANAPFTSVWSAVGAFDGPNFDDGEAVVWDYLLYWINDQFASRRPFLYYNTWGMQRSVQNRGGDPRAILTLDRVLQELAYADQLGIDLFVLDDGWQVRFGDWVPDTTKYPQGLAPLRHALEQHDVIFGIWLATLATDSDSEVAAAHPDWLIRDEVGAPVIGNWDRQVFCFVSDYRDHFVRQSKWLIDQGVRYFKWDGIDKHLCDAPHHHHGDDSVPAPERRMRYGYELTRYLTDAARELTEYDSTIVIEFDVTEPERSVGLAFLSEGRYFWMNNGASWYGDLSTYRMKSMRMVPALFHAIVPPVLQTAANYPHEDPTYNAQRHGINTSLLGGRGFWGDLSEMSEPERLRVGQHVADAKRVLEASARVRPRVEGTVGSSPEIYAFVDTTSGAGQVIAFSGSALVHAAEVHDVDPEHVLAVLRNAYRTADGKLYIDFVFPHPDATREAFLIPNGGSAVKVRASTSWLADASWENETLRIVAGAPGVHEIFWPFALAPTVSVSDGETVSTTMEAEGMHVVVRTAAPRSVVTLTHP